MIDVLVAGAGPAGSVAAIVLARAGARVLVVDRARFPRDKLCGDTVNPGTLAMLDRLGLGNRLEEGGVRIDGMILTGESGVRVQERYGGQVYGRAVRRRDLDYWLVQAAIAAGARFEEGVTVRAPIVETAAGDPRPHVRGLVVSHRQGQPIRMTATITIAADGRRSAATSALHLARHPVRPRRWAIGAYFEGVHGVSSFGEMHVRRHRYIGVAPLPGGLTNVCLVAAPRDDEWLPDPGQVLRRAIAGDRQLSERFVAARMVSAPSSLGPLAVEVRTAGAPGILLAGDAAGFIDPMTGDGLRFAIRGGELAARAALDALACDPTRAHERLARWRAREFAAKWRFNRAVRALTGSPARVRCAELAAALAPVLLRRAIVIAGDVSRLRMAE